MSSRTSTPSSAPPPSLSIKQPTPQLGAYEGFNWSDEVDRNEAEQNEAPPTPTASSVSINLGPDGYKSPPYRGRGRDPGGPVEPDRGYDYYEEDRPRRTRAAAMEDLFNDDSFDNDSFDDEPRADPVRNGPRPWGVHEDVDNDSEAGVKDDLWQGYNAPRQEPQTRIRRVKKAGEEKEKEDWFCLEHGPMCNPGICKARAERERKVRREIDEKRWAEERAKRNALKEKRARKREQKEAAEAAGYGSSDSTETEDGLRSQGV
jgi:hypothetical protein